MGCFSYICKVCGTSIRSDSASGEHCTLYLLKDGKVQEHMTGHYDSYGTVYEPGEWQTEDWGEIVELHFNRNTGDGIAAVHTKCGVPGLVPNEASDDDPEQGWQKMRKSYMIPA